MLSNLSLIRRGILVWLSGSGEVYGIRGFWGIDNYKINKL